MALTAPICAVSSSVNGYKIIELDPELGSYSVKEGLTEDAVSARLHKGGLAPPLYVHRPDNQSISTRLGGATIENEWRQRIRHFMKYQTTTVKYYNMLDPVEGLLDIVRRDLGKGADYVFTQIPQDLRTRPKPLFQSTASQLGIHPTRGIPNLLDYILPITSQTSQIPRRYMHRLILMPPPTDVANSIRMACQILSVLTTPLPRWTILDSSVVVKLINERQTNEFFFRDLHKVLSATQEMFRDPQLEALAKHLLQAVNLEAGWFFEPHTLLSGCRAAEEMIENVVTASEVPPPPLAEENEGGSEVMKKFFTLNENFRGKIKDSLLQNEISRVERTGSKLFDAIHNVFAPLSRGNSRDPARLKPVLKLDVVNNAVWIKFFKGSHASKDLEESKKAGSSLNYIHPTDRNGKLCKDVLSTEEIEDSLHDYRDACDDAHAQVKNQLRRLAAELQGSISHLRGAITLGIIASALDSHVTQAIQSNWVMPVQLTKQDASSEGPTFHAMEVEGMWPYWMDGRDDSTVRNDLTLNSMVILTGPNMAGKSSIMRSLCSVALLSACGLYAPVEKAIVPYTDAFMLRTFSADAPIEGRSSFAVEMNEMNHVMDNVSENSLVLVDELGKGTEPHAGAAIAASFLETLGNSRCRGVFATHLHQLLDMQEPLGLRFDNVGHMRMETVEASELGERGFGASAQDPGSLTAIAGRMGGNIPTWKIREGSCRHSLAFAVMAQQCGEDKAVVKRALQLYEEHKALRGGIQNTPTLIGKPSEPSNGLADYAQYRVDQSSPSPQPSTSRPIEVAATLLKEQASRVFKRLRGSNALEDHPQEPPSSNAVNGSHPTSVGATMDETTQIVRVDQAPPPATTGRSCIYILRTPGGEFYVGESDKLSSRLRRHRLKLGKGGPSMEATYTMVPVNLQGKSAARDLESSVINRMQKEGFPLLSVADGRGKRSPRAMS